MKNKSYWEKRLGSNQNLRGVGHIDYSERYNSYLYCAKIRALLRAVNGHRVRIKDSEVLDVGSGTGFWINWYLQAGASHVTGVEISHSAAEKLAQKYQKAKVYKVDICKALPFKKQFNIINAFDVLYHITLDKEFKLALSNIAEHLAPGGYLFLTDLFPRQDQSPAKHVCFHSLSAYERVFTQNGFTILSIYPMYLLLNGMLFDWLTKINPKLRRLVRIIEELSVPLLYKLDGICISRRLSNLKLMIVKRKQRIVA